MVRFARLLPTLALGKVADLESADVVVVVGNEKFVVDLLWASSSKS